MFPLKMVVPWLPFTLPETKIASKNGWLEYYFPIGEAYFQGLPGYVSFREGSPEKNPSLQ